MQPAPSVAPEQTIPTDGARPTAVATVSRLAIAAVGAYVGAQVIADITSVKIGSTFGRAVDMGTFIYPITFTLRDVVHKALGRRAARTLIVTAAVVNLFMAIYLQWVARVPSDESYPLGDEFRAVLGPLWRIVVASIIAEVISELLDTEVYHWFVRRVTTRYQWARVAVSNAVSIPVDNAIFAIGAFGSLPRERSGGRPAFQDRLRDRSVRHRGVRLATTADRPRADAALGRRVGHLRCQPVDQGAGVGREPAPDLRVAGPRLAQRSRRRVRGPAATPLTRPIRRGRPRPPTGR